MFCSCAGTPPAETTASADTTTSAETTAAETTTEAPIATETTYIESLCETKVKLSTLSEEDLRKFFTDAGWPIPKMYERLSLRELVIKLEQDPYYENGSNYTDRFDTAARILVSEYYDMPRMPDWWFPYWWFETNATNSLTERN